MLHYSMYSDSVERSMSVGQRPMKSLSSVRLSVRLSVRSSVNFFKIGSLVFSDVLRDDN